MAIPIWRLMSTPHSLAWAAARPNAAPSPIALFPRRIDPTGRPGLTVETLDLDEAEAIRADWRDLMDRALEPNVFMEPAFALSAAQHFAELRRPRFVAVWDRRLDGRRGRLLALWPLEARAPAFAPGLVRGWSHEHMTLGVPALDRARAGEAIDAVLASLASVAGEGGVLMASQLVRSGPTYGALVARAQATGRLWRDLDAHERAVLPGGSDPDAFIRAALSPRRRKEIQRQRRRLEDIGPVKVRSARGPEEVRVAMETFLAMEQRGWKGRRATSLLSHPYAATFARSMARLMAREGKCRIDSLEIGGRPVAMGVVLTSGERAYFWKTAYDETFAPWSPGVHLALALTRRQLVDPTVELTDSCAIPFHPMIDRIWRDRQEIVDLAIAVSPSGAKAAGRTIAIEGLRRSLRRTAKTLIRGAPKRPNPKPAGAPAPLH